MNCKFKKRVLGVKQGQVHPTEFKADEVVSASELGESLVKQFKIMGVIAEEAPEEKEETKDEDEKKEPKLEPVEKKLNLSLEDKSVDPIKENKRSKKSTKEKK